MGLQTCMAKDHAPYCGLVRGPRRQLTVSDTLLVAQIILYLFIVRTVT
jgi:hypothetical protein